MKKSSIYLTLALAVGLWSCSSEDIPNNVVEGNDSDVYATLSFDFGKTRGTRSETVDPGDNPAESDAGFEIGKNEENNVETLIVVLATQGTDGKYTRIADSGICNASPVTNTTDGAAGVPNPVYRVRFSSKELISHAGEKVFAFAYCNPTVSFVQAIEAGNWSEDMQETITHADNSYIWSSGHFLMTSAELHPVTLPTTDDFNTKYSGITKPFPIGTVLVHRAAARFDFAGTKIGEYADNTYPIYDYIEDQENPNGQIQGFVTIDGMALFNEARNFYYLSRVADNIGGDGQDSHASTSSNLLWPERTNNWVISPDPKEFYYSINGSLAEGATNPPANPESFIYTPISAIISGTPDNDENWNDDKTMPDYRIWRYTTENTIPSVAGQIHGISTGVLFRGHISAPAGTTLNAAIQTAQPIYSYAGKMYGNLNDLKKYVAAYPGSALSVAFQSDFNVTFNESMTSDQITNAIANVTDLTKSTKYFDVYKADSTTGNYYVYYYYYNRHNDNGNNVVMGRMEFATVRNNVYKLKLTNIYRWGNPGDKPTDPDDPDEEPELFCRVQVEVLPWVVRINNIEF